jgi:hypothetical protein
VVTSREKRDSERAVTNAAALSEARDGAETVVATATHVEDRGFTPFDALHLVESDGDTTVSSDETYEPFAPRLDSRPSKTSDSVSPDVLRACVDVVEGYRSGVVRRCLFTEEGVFGGVERVEPQ